MRSINFKASVRYFSGGMRQLMCNDYDSSRNFDTMIFLDLNTYAEVQFHAGDLVEIGLKYSCYLFCEALKSGGRVGFSANSADEGQKFFFLPCESGETHVKRILERFATLNSFTKRDYSMAALLRNYAPGLKPETDIYIVSPYIDEKTAEMILEVRVERMLALTPEPSPSAKTITVEFSFSSTTSTWSPQSSSPT